MLLILKTAKRAEDMPKNYRRPGIIQWYHGVRKQFEIIELTDITKRTLEEVKKEYPDAFEDTLRNIVVSMANKSPRTEAVRAPIVEAKAAEKVPQIAYKCDACQYSSDSLGGVRRHITRMHGKDSCAVLDKDGNKVKSETE